GSVWARAAAVKIVKKVKPARTLPAKEGSFRLVIASSSKFLVRIWLSSENSAVLQTIGSCLPKVDGKEKLSVALKSVQKARGLQHKSALQKNTATQDRLSMRI
ncbi:MAG TPA: hypothetical protein VLT16_18135, partial [Candidatus Limnocylindrales bacterium]|nr:hypothetical protein [Candidatus Limnocylindrales bacterium]